jgi:hypothetical protein
VTNSSLGNPWQKPAWNGDDLRTEEVGGVLVGLGGRMTGGGMLVGRGGGGGRGARQERRNMGRRREKKQWG